MVEKIDNEIEAIRAVLSALEPLPPTVRTRVLEYVVKRLQVSIESVSSVPIEPVSATPAQQVPPQENGSPTHIKDLKEKKKPRSANEMAALTAFFLSDLAPARDRKRTVNTKDIKTYFKIAGFPLPEHVNATLPNAKNAGYFDAAGGGEYRLNAVGHNLVVHSMPRGSSDTSAKRKPTRKPTRRTSKKR
jgi:hypothetical protein